MKRWAMMVGAAVLASAGSASALRADLVDKAVKVDGLLKEWAPLTALSSKVKGDAVSGDLTAKAAISYDANAVYVAADVTDDALKVGGDKVVVTLGFPGGKTHSIELKPGGGGKAASATVDGKAANGAKVVEAAASGSWTLEASIPWSALGHAKTTRIGLRGVIAVHDADASATPDAVVATSTGTDFASMPGLSMQPEQAMLDGLIREKSIRSSPKYNLIGDVTGDAFVERVIVYDKYLVVLGSAFREGKEYYYVDLVSDASQGMLPQLELRDVTGDGKADIVMRKRVGSASRYREVFQVLSFHAGGDAPASVFTHEVGISTDAGSVVNDVTVTGSQIKIEAGSAKGYDASSYREPVETNIDALLLPWGGTKSQTYKFSGGSFSKTGEEKQAEKAPKAAAAVAIATPAATEAKPKAPAPPSASELLEKVYDLYKKDRGASGAARFDTGVDVAGDATRERVLLHGKELVVFGKGYKSGTGYTYLALPQFAQSRDITDVTTQDLTGDGKAEVIVRGLVMGTMPKEAGGGTVAREVVLVFQVGGDKLSRVFAAEIGRNLPKGGRVVGSIKYVQNGKSVDIELGPGRAEKCTQAEYPFAQDTSAVGGFEPLILPWGKQPSVRYKWSGSVFSK